MDQPQKTLTWRLWGSAHPTNYELGVEYDEGTRRGRRSVASGLLDARIALRAERVRFPGIGVAVEVIVLEVEISVAQCRIVIDRVVCGAEVQIDPVGAVIFYRIALDE